MPRFELIAGLDIGATKVSLAVIKREFGAGSMQFLGSFSVDCEGLSASGAVSGLSKLADAISMVLDKAQSSIKQNISTAFVNIAGTHITAENARGRINLLSKENEISRKDLEAVYNNAKVSAISYDRQPALVVPQDYIVDGQTAIKNPLGLFGSRFEVDYLFITGSTPTIANLSKTVNMGGIEIDEVVLSNLASSFAVLNNSEKDLGVILIDIGNVITEITVFTDGIIRNEIMSAVGASSVADAISAELNVRPDIAAKIIKNYCKLPSSNYANPDEKILIKEVSPHKTITGAGLQAIIEPRVKDILNNIKQLLQSCDYAPSASCGIALIGGISSMDGFAEMAEPLFNMPVKVGLSKIANTNLTALGLALYGYQKKNAGGLRKQFSKNVFKRAFQSAKDFVYDYF